MIRALLLSLIGVSADQLARELDRQLEQAPKVTGGAQAQMSKALSRIMEAAFEEAAGMQDEYISTEHLLLAVASDDGDASGRMLRSVGANREGILQALQSIRGSAKITDQDPESKYQSLDLLKHFFFGVLESCIKFWNTLIVEKVDQQIHKTVKVVTPTRSLRYQLVASCEVQIAFKIF